MALQFFAVHSEALASTYDALQRHASAHGLRPAGPTRALRIAQLYGYLQLRAAGRSSLGLALSELAACWRFQPRQLRQDLALLQELGWLSARTSNRGTVISLHGPAASERTVAETVTAGVTAAVPAACSTAPVAGAAPSQAGAPPTAMASRPAAEPSPPTPQVADTRPENPANDPSPQPIQRAAAAKASALPPSDGSGDLLTHLAALYNQHRPESWPAYQPRGHGLRSKIRQALRQAGGVEALAATLTAALQAMPSFWRHTYPQGRSGAECMAALFSTDRGSAGLGVEFWHLFTWAQGAAATTTVGTTTVGSTTAGTSRGMGSGAGLQRAPGQPQTNAAGSADPEAELRRARRLFLWDSGVWQGQGREALLLSQAEKRQLAMVLEANGEGIAGSAERQFADPDPEPNPDPDRVPDPEREP